MRKAKCVGFFIFVALLLHLESAAQQDLADSLASAISAADQAVDHRPALAQYIADHADNDLHSKVTGTVSKGSLINGKLIPFQGDNFRYYDTLSYLDDRAYVHDKVKNAVLATYADLAVSHPGRIFTIMECSKKNGGKIWPHRTHQNGLSIDFMVPLVQNGLPFYGLDTIGFQHYLLDFKSDGSSPDDPTVKIDFDLLAAHLIALQAHARQNGLKISKILLRQELHDELFASNLGTQLKALHLYFPTGLEPLINQLHDNHYHVDFELVGG